MPETIAIIPARGGSKRVPRKNLFVLGGRPLICHSIEHALAAESVDAVYVSTEDPEIAEVARAAGAEVVERPADLAGDAASSESALLHVLDARGAPDPELVVFLQATSPVRAHRDIDAAVAALRSQQADSLFSACEDRGLLWTLGADGPQPVNYDPLRRLREQDMGPQIRENGSIYVFRPRVLRETGARLGGKIAVHEMDPWSSFQVDTPEDVGLIAWILAHHIAPAPWAAGVELVVLDFDGVLTDNRALVDETGREAVFVSRSDGWGIARLREAGVPVVVVSTEANPVVAARCRKLGIDFRQDVADKPGAVRELADAHGAALERVVFVGNDVNDLPALAAVGIPVAVGDARPEVAAAARHVLRHDGGRGAVRELCDLLLAARGGAA